MAQPISLTVLCRKDASGGAERRIGELMAAQKEAGLLKPGGDTGRNQHEAWVADGPKPPTLSEVGIDKHLADRARKLAAVPAAEFEGRVQQWRGEVREVSDRVTVNLLESGARQKSTRWRHTPQAKPFLALTPPRAT